MGFWEGWKEGKGRCIGEAVGGEGEPSEIGVAVVVGNQGEGLLWQ